jgi:Flp pilus assembly protein TadD
MAAYLPKVNLLFELGRYDAAETELRAALAANPDDALAHAMLGVALSRLKRIDEALAESETAIGLDPVNSYLFYLRSLVLIRADRPQEALEAVRTAIEWDSTAPEYSLILAALLFDKEQWVHCLAELDRALSLDPHYVGCLNLRGRALVKLGRMDEAKQTLDSAIAAEPENAGAHHARGAMLLNSLHAHSALEHLLEARRLDPVAENDIEAIALALGRQMRPFRWISPFLLRWELWPPKATWGLFTALLFAYVALNANFPMSPGVPFLPTLIGCIAAGTLFAPYCFDSLAASTALLARRRLTGATWSDLFMQGLGLHMALCYYAVLTAVGMLPPLFVLVLCAGTCWRFTWHFFHCNEGDQTALVVYVVYAVPLTALAATMFFLMNGRPSDCWLPAAVFAFLAFFSDDVLDWIRRHESQAGGSPGVLKRSTK